MCIRDRHIPATAETKGFVNDSLIAQMKHGVRILNFARGELVNTACLLYTSPKLQWESIFHKKSHFFNTHLILTNRCAILYKNEMGILLPMMMQFISIMQLLPFVKRDL